MGGVMVDLVSLYPFVLINRRYNLGELFRDSRSVTTCAQVQLVSLRVCCTPGGVSLTSVSAMGCDRPGARTWRKHGFGTLCPGTSKLSCCACCSWITLLLGLYLNARGPCGWFPISIVMVAGGSATSRPDTRSSRSPGASMWYPSNGALNQSVLSKFVTNVITPERPQLRPEMINNRTLLLLNLRNYLIHDESDLRRHIRIEPTRRAPPRRSTTLEGEPLLTAAVGHPDPRAILEGQVDDMPRSRSVRRGPRGKGGDNAAHDQPASRSDDNTPWAWQAFHREKHKREEMEKQMDTLVKKQKSDDDEKFLMTKINAGVTACLRMAGVPAALPGLAPAVPPGPPGQQPPLPPPVAPAVKMLNDGAERPYRPATEFSVPSWVKWSARETIKNTPSPDQEMVDFWGLAGPGGPGNPFKGGGLRSPPFKRVSRAGL